MERQRYSRSARMVLLWLASVASGPRQARPDTTCSAVFDAFQVHVTCFFSTNINVTRHNFNVKYFSPGTEPETVLMCNWQETLELKCLQQTYCRFNSLVSEELTLYIDGRFNRTEGRFRCQLVPSDDHVAVDCALTAAPSTLASTSPGAPAGLTAPGSSRRGGVSPKNQSLKVRTACTSYAWSPLVSGLVASNVALLAALATSIAITFRERKRQKAKRLGFGRGGAIYRKNQAAAHPGFNAQTAIATQALQRPA